MISIFLYFISLSNYFTYPKIVYEIVIRTDALSGSCSADVCVRQLRTIHYISCLCNIWVSGWYQGCLWGGPPARPVHPIDLRARLVRVKRALTGGHGKSDLPCPRWLPRGPPRRRGSGRRRVARHGRNGAYGTSGADAMARTGCRALTLWATTGRRARTGRTDGRGRGLRKRFCGCGRKWQVRVCGRGRFGQYSYVDADAMAGIVMRART
jgi:hypothetical protein